MEEFIIPWDSGWGNGVRMTVDLSPGNGAIRFKSLDKDQDFTEDQVINLTIKTLFVNILTSVKRPKIALKIIRQANLPSVLVDSQWKSPVSSDWKFIVLKK